MRIWQKRLGSLARQWNTQIKVIPTQVHEQMGHPLVCTRPQREKNDIRNSFVYILYPTIAVSDPGGIPRPELSHPSREPGGPAAVDRGLPDVRGVYHVPRMLGVGHVGRHEQAHLRHADRAGRHAAPHAG